MLGAPVQPYLSKLFGSTLDADCVIRFTLASDNVEPHLKKARAGAPASPPVKAAVESNKADATDSPATPISRLCETGQALNGDNVTAKDSDVKRVADAKSGDHCGPTFIGEAIPAHRVVLRCGSERFRAYMERWEQPAPAALPPGATNCPKPDTNDTNDSGHGERNIESADGTSTPLTRKRPAPDASSCALSGLPELLVPLGSEQELPAARRALRLLYSGFVPYSLGFKEILATRRMGSYLQIERCEAACNAAMVVKLEKEGRTDSSIVLDLYECWHHFPEDASFSSVLSAGQKHLVRHFGDALAILNTDRDKPGTLARQFMSLPPQAVEALLSSDDFGTDSEASVLLLLPIWFDAYANYRYGVSTGVNLCRLIRVLHLGKDCISYVLPRLDWFAATPRQRTALTALATTSDPAARKSLLMSLRRTKVDLGIDADELLKQQGCESQPDLTPRRCKWLAPARRQCLTSPDGRVYTWRVQQQDLLDGLKAALAPHDNPATVLVGICPASFVRPCHGSAAGDEDAAEVYMYGLSWQVRFVIRSDGTPSICLKCTNTMASN
ncbi:hypothetical protein Agub_g1582, partial [Astrephomene gubernaculifera]